MNRRAYQVALWISAGLAFVLALAPARADDDAQATEALWLTDHAKLVHKVKTLVIGDVDLKDVTLDQAVDFLRHQSKLSDPDHQGINFVLKVDQFEIKAIKVSVKIKNATVEDVLLRFPMIRSSIGDFTVDLEPGGGDGAYRRTFHVADNVLAINPSMLIDKDKQTYDVKSLFQAKGIKFGPGESATYVLPAKTLTVVFVYQKDIIHVDELLVFGCKAKK